MENNIKHIDEAIYELGPDKVTKKKGSIIPALISLVIGGGMVAVAFMPAVKGTENLYVGLIFMGGLLMLIGLVLLFIVLLGSGGRPYYVSTGEYLKRTETYYGSQHFAKVRDCVLKGDFERLAGIEGGMETAVMVIMYTGKKTGVTICQVFTYIPHNYEPAEVMLVFEKSGSAFVLI